MASWFTRSRQPQAQLGPPWAVPEAQLFDDDEDPAGRLLRRRVRWEVVDEARNARLAGQEAFLSLAVLRLSSDSGIGARIPLTSIHREEYMQPIFGANYLTGLAMQDGATVRWTLEFLSAGAAQFASVFFRAVRAARSGTTNAAAIQASARVASAAEAETCVWAEAVPVDGAPTADLPTATAL
jgi:hypothetical protein